MYSRGIYGVLWFNMMNVMSKVHQLNVTISFKQIFCKNVSSNKNFHRRKYTWIKSNDMVTALQLKGFVKCVCHSSKAEQPCKAEYIHTI